MYCAACAYTAVLFINETATPNLRTLYVSKLAKCPLICLADLAGDLSEIARSASKGERLDKPALVRAVQQTYHHCLYSSENSSDEWLDKYFENGQQIGRFAHCRKLPVSILLPQRAEQLENLWPRPLLSYYGPGIGYATQASAASWTSILKQHGGLLF